MNADWLPIRYRDFYDLPRAFIVSCDGQTFFFDCPFDEAADDYLPSYSVFKIAPEKLPLLERTSWADFATGLSKIGDVTASADIFDPSKRSAVRADVIRELLRLIKPHG